LRCVNSFGVPLSHPAGMKRKARTTTDKDRLEAVLLAVEAEVLGIAIESMTDDKNVAALARQLRAKFSELRQELRTECAKRDIHYDIADRQFRKVLARVALMLLS
jgi:hypothetical protein